MALTPSILTSMTVNSGSGTSVLTVTSTNSAVANSTALCKIPLDAGHGGGTVRVQSTGEATFDCARVEGSSGLIYNQCASTATVDITINYTAAETFLDLKFVKDGSVDLAPDRAIFTVTETQNANASIAPTALTVTADGASVAPTTLTVIFTTGTSVAQTRLSMTADGASVAPTSLVMTASSGTSVAPTSLVMTATTSASVVSTTLIIDWPNSSSTAQTKLTVTATGASIAASQLAVLSAAVVPVWTARCIIGGVDVSARLTGQASVDAEEGAARVATVVLAPVSGVIVPLDYVGKVVTLDYVLLVGGAEIARRIFTGRVDTPQYNTDTALLVLECVDDLQNRVAALNRDILDGLIGGRYTEAVQGFILDGWDYAQARLSTVASSLDAGAAGDIRVTPWQISTTWATYTNAELLYERSGLSFPQRSTLINRVDAEFQYRYPRLRQRYTSVGWSGSVIGGQMAAAGYAFPTIADVLSSGGGSGWTVVSALYSFAPKLIAHSSGGFIHTADGSIDLAVLFMTQRHSQSVTENYTITVTAPESVTANGELTHSIRGALASSFEGSAWESALDVPPIMASGGDIDWAPDATRSDSNYAIETLLDQARVAILGSHRSTRVTNAVLCDPDLDLNRRVVIAASAISASGKVVRVSHLLDFAAGSALSEFDIACFGVGGAGIITPDVLSAPGAPSPAYEVQNWKAESASLIVSVYGSTPYTDNLMGLLANPPETLTVFDVPTPDGPKTQTFPNPSYVGGPGYPVTGFRIRMPGVSDADRNPVEKASSSNYQIVVPSDPITLTVP